MANVPDYIGFPGSQINQISGEKRLEFDKHMKQKMTIAEIVPCLPDFTATDGNIYEAKDAIGEFNKDLAHAGHHLNGSALKIVISTQQPITETYENNFGESTLFPNDAMGNSAAGKKLQEVAYMTGVQSTQDIQKKMEQLAKTQGIEGLIGRGGETLSKLYNNGAIGNLKRVSEALLDSGHEKLSRAVNMAADYAKTPWGKINWPQMWQNCSYQQSYNLNTRLYCYNCKSDADYDRNIRASLAALQLLVTPRSENGVLYTWPYIVKFSISGVIDMPLAYCSNLTIIKGGNEHDFAQDGRPNVIDVSMNIQNCYGICVNTQKELRNRPSVKNSDRAISYDNVSAEKKKQTDKGSMGGEKSASTPSQTNPSSYQETRPSNSIADEAAAGLAGAVLGIA